MHNNPERNIARNNSRSRRCFMKELCAGAVTAVGVNAAANSARAENQEKEKSAGLPTITLGDHTLTRLVVGSNPICGYSHSSDLLTRHMLEYFTLDKTVEFIQRCEQLGINTWQTGFNEKIEKAIKILRDKGSKIRWFCLASDRSEGPTIEHIASLKPIAIVHHGGVTDRLFRNNESEKVRDFVKRIHDAGVMAGVSAHNPANIAHIAEKDWENDFFMTCFYYVTRPREEMRRTMGNAPLGEPFLENDPDVMTGVVRQAGKPCFGFKILAAGRLCWRDNQVESAFKYAFSHIKKTDGVIVGMYPRFKDEISENIQYTLKYGMNV